MVFKLFCLRMVILTEFNPLCLALKIIYEYGWFFLYLHARRIWRRITINDKFCERWKLILATIKVKICSKERMTKNLWLFINKLNNKKLRYSFCKLDVCFIVFCGDIVNPTTNWYAFHLCEYNHTEDEFLY